MSTNDPKADHLLQWSKFTTTEGEEAYSAPLPGFKSMNATLVCLKRAGGLARHVVGIQCDKGRTRENGWHFIGAVFEDDSFVAREIAQAWCDRNRSFLHRCLQQRKFPPGNEFPPPLDEASLHEIALNLVQRAGSPQKAMEVMTEVILRHAANAKSESGKKSGE
jgi:hypothetical protein